VIQLSPTPSPEELRPIADRIFRHGAVIVCGDATPILVGDFRWEEPGRINWFRAFGDRATDAASFSFDFARAEDARIVFRHSTGGEIELLAIDQAKLEDPDDYRVAWQIWQHVGPLHRRLIETAYRASSPDPMA
jgi:hypothetical protein